MRILVSWLPVLAVSAWFYFIEWLCGTLPALLAAFTGLAVALLAMWEAGAHKEAE